MTTVLAQSKERTRRNGTRWSIRLERKWPDAWVGAFWSTTTGSDHRWAALDVWVCVVPCFPIHFFANRKPPPLYG